LATGVTHAVEADAVGANASPADTTESEKMERAVMGGGYTAGRKHERDNFMGRISYGA
jgi:hypothetical protein